MALKETPLDQLVEQFHRQGRLRVWSLVITIFGDAVQPRGGRISSARLQAILARLGIESGALRTAMSRLVKDGWIERDRQGRNSYYRLSTKGNREFGPATQRIYAAPLGNSPEEWVLAVSLDRSADNRVALEKKVLDMRGLVLGAGAYLWPWLEAPASQWMVENGLLSVAGDLDNVPAEIRESLAPKGQRGDFESLIKDFSPLRSTAATLPPLDAMAARTLLIHRWRRIVLRGPDVPGELLPHDWPERRCRSLVAGLYHHLMQPSEHWLAAEDKALGNRLPEPESAFYTRFG